MTTTGTRQGRSRRFVGAIGLMGLACGVIGLAGCPFAGLPDSTALSETESVPIRDGVTVEVPLGAGAPGAADSTWAIHKADDDSLLFRIALGSNGEIERFFDSFVFAKEWLGSEVIPDTQVHPTDFPGGSYIAGGYVGEQDGRVGVLGVVHGLLLGAHLGTATLSFSGPIDGDRIDGTMVRTVTVFAKTPFPAPVDAEFDAYALRER